MIAPLLASALLAQTAPNPSSPPSTTLLAPPDRQSAPAEPSNAPGPDGPSDAARARAESLLGSKDARPELIYNAGVEMYRAGQYDLAGELFASAESRAKAGVAARSMYNRGTTTYAEAVESMKAAGEDGQDASRKQQSVVESLERSLRELKDAVRADPANADARANAELAYRVLKELKKQQKQDQQKQDQQKQDQQKQDQQKQDQQKQDQQQTEAKADKKPMSQDEVDRLLQRIRDKERARLLEKLSRERSRTKPAPKDW